MLKWNRIIGQINDWSRQFRHQSAIRAIRGCLLHFHKWQYVEVNHHHAAWSVLKYECLSHVFFSTWRSNLSQRFSVTNQALVNLTEWPDVNVPITSDDILSILNKQPQSWDGIPFGKLNRTEFLRQLNDFRYVHSLFFYFYFLFVLNRMGSLGHSYVRNVTCTTNTHLASCIHPSRVNIHNFIPLSNEIIAFCVQKFQERIGFTRTNAETNLRFSRFLRFSSACWQSFYALRLFLFEKISLHQTFPYS